ncbi:ketopantoate reductase family protein [Papillibacter cinnamivorans]|uniref:2-dehydropantoate 2-reductase n=1 Tax=Papillibacter cinnamivorans DSM 12816 TaxID=1122930 RepID=A0A1W1ZDI1_9FIRM|nr:ketopantoate reductase family protein [Papillibacter cinnamivorans]SMC46292.1 2-dehydropantoate 2-reductase [Papillibacter cinnamivorans DSM 12816]
MIKRIAVMGVGSLGTILGAYLSRGGLDVTLVDAWKEHVDALNTKGARVTGGVEMTIPVKACTPDQMEGTFDLFIYLAKQTFNATAIPQMVAHCHKDTIICTGQNGLPELAVAEKWPKSQVCGSPVGWPATFLGPGVSQLSCTEDSPFFTFHLGTVEGPITPWLLEVKAILEKMCPVHLTENLMADRWSKVLINSTFSGMSTVIGGTFGDALADDKGAKCIVHIGREVVKVCQAMNMVLPPIFGVDFFKLYDFTTPEGEKNAIDVVRKTLGGNQGEASMLQDLRKGRKCEIFAINGVVSDTARKYGIETPYCDAVVRVVSEIEAGKRTLGKQNLDGMPD